ncbi:UNVERIFIED_CONTAM: hypothetical protein H355_000402 [Colinus virginianus]|nr:hypothetical protein H355_000402 [Colinus virginianus]
MTSVSPIRDVIERLFSDAIEQRKEDIQQNSDVARSLATFQKYGNDQISTAPNTGRFDPRGRGFFSGVLTALTCVAVSFIWMVVLLGYHWSSREFEDDLLVHKPVAKWTAEEVTLWLEQLGPWTSHYKERFLLENVNGRLLLTLTEEDFTKEPYSIENSNHRKAIMAELECVKALGVKPPQNLWEYKVNPLCIDLKDPTWKQWREFIVKYMFLPYQLIAEFAWDWMDVHYWTSRFIIVNAMLLSVLELISFWKLWSRRELRVVKNKASKPLPFLFHRTVPHRMWKHFWRVSTQGLFVAVFWPFIPQFVCNCLFYWALYFNPIINIDFVVKEVRRLETQVH